MIRLAPRAERWLLDYITALAADNPGAARNILNRLERLRQNLTAFPRMAPSGLIPGTRRAVLGPLVLTLLERNGRIEIAAIRHARQEDAYAPSDLLEELGFLTVDMRDGDHMDEPD